MNLTNIGQFCTQWLLQSAPLSLRQYTGPLQSKDQLAVETRYSRSIDNSSVPPISLTLAPLDNVEWNIDHWFTDDNNIFV